MSSRLWKLVGVAALAASSAGCSSTSTCSRDAESSDVWSGLVNEDHTVYVSAKYGEGPYTHFPANQTITFHVGLRDVPTAITVLLGFSADTAPTTAPSAGNMSLVKSMTKDAIVLKNDTCSEFYVWLSASTSATALAPVDAGAEALEAAGGAAN